MNPERSTEKPRLPLKARITAGLTLGTAAFLASCSGGDKQENTQNPTQSPETPTPTLQITPEPTPIPTPEITPVPTETPIVGRILSQDEYKAEFARVYSENQSILPAAVCGISTIHSLIDLNYTNDIQYPGNPAGFASGFAVLARELKGIQALNNSKSVRQLAADIYAIAESKNKEQLQINEVDSNLIGEVMSSWDLNTTLPSSFNNGQGCTISAEQKP